MDLKKTKEETNFIGCGAIHTLVIEKWRNTVWGFGWNGRGQLGLNTEEDNNLSPKKLSSNLPKMKSITCGGDHSVLISDDGNVYVAGSNDSGQLGIENHFAPSFIPLPLYFTEKRIVLAACGNEHSLFLDEEGFPWCCGKNSHGQLGLGDYNDRTIPHMIHFDKKIQSIACGRYHSLMIDENKQVWSFGSNDHGQLGLTAHSSNFSTPQVIETLYEIESIACGCCHSIAVDGEGNLWSFGDNSAGQLGLSDFEARNFPTKLKIFAHIEKIRCGSVHSIALDKSGIVWAFGSNHLGQLGFHSDEESVNTPQPIIMPAGFPKISEIECGAYHTVFIDVFGSFWSTGRNFSGQLGVNDADDRHSPTKILELSWASQYLSIITPINLGEA